MKKSLLILIFAFATFLTPNKIFAQQVDAFLGEIRMVGFNFVPQGWARCDGRLLPISSNTALFSLLGTMYGGDGQTTFALPDLRGRVAIGQGQGPGLSTTIQGEIRGSENVTLTAQNIPPHSHPLMVSSGKGTSSSPTGNFLADTSVLDKEYAATSNSSMNNGAIGLSNGHYQPINIMQPSLTVNYIIALYGIFPSRE